MLSKITKLSVFGQNTQSFNKDLKGLKPMKRLEGCNPSGLYHPEISQPLNVKALIPVDPEVFRIQTKEALDRQPLIRKDLRNMILKKQSEGPEKMLQNHLNRIMLERYQKIQNSFLTPEQKEKAIAEVLGKMGSMPAGLMRNADAYAEAAIANMAPSMASSMASSMAPLRSVGQNSLQSGFTEGTSLFEDDISTALSEMASQVGRAASMGAPGLPGAALPMGARTGPLSESDTGLARRVMGIPLAPEPIVEGSDIPAAVEDDEDGVPLNTLPASAHTAPLQTPGLYPGGVKVGRLSARGVRNISFPDGSRVQMRPSTAKAYLEGTDTTRQTGAIDKVRTALRSEEELEKLLRDIMT